MGVWVVPAIGVDEVGAKMSQNKAVSHCYLRPVYDDWPYNLYTIVHGRSVDECESIINDIAIDTGVDEKQALYPTREYKKARINLFSTEADEWEAAHGARPLPARRRKREPARRDARVPQRVYLMFSGKTLMRLFARSSFVSRATRCIDVRRLLRHQVLADAVLHRVERLGTGRLLPFDIDQVIAELRVHDAADHSRLHAPGGLFERGIELTLDDPPEVAAALARSHLRSTSSRPPRSARGAAWPSSPSSGFPCAAATSAARSSAAILLDPLQRLLPPSSAPARRSSRR